MPLGKNPRGICAACAHGHYCVNHHGTAITQCEDFAEIAAHPQFAPAVRSLRITYGLGICSACSVQAGCQLPKAVTGVLQCEEFRS